MEYDEWSSQADKHLAFCSKGIPFELKGSGSSTKSFPIFADDQWVNSPDDLAKVHLSKIDKLFLPAFLFAKDLLVDRLACTSKNVLLELKRNALNSQNFLDGCYVAIPYLNHQ